MYLQVEQESPKNNNFINMLDDTAGLKEISGLPCFYFIEKFVL